MNRTKSSSDTPNLAASANGDEVPSAEDNGHPANVRDISSAQKDLFALESLKCDQDFTKLSGAKSLLTTVPVKKPSKEVFIRCHPSPDFRIQTLVLELKDDKDKAIYLLSEELRPILAMEATVSLRWLITYITRAGNLGIWPIRLPGSDGKLDTWNKSALVAAQEAESRWVRVTPDQSVGAYSVVVGPDKVPAPTWPDIDFQGIIRIAFKDYMISDWDHPVLKKLRLEE
jgi:hypothetical protein